MRAITIAIHQERVNNAPKLNTNANIRLFFSDPTILNYDLFAFLSQITFVIITPRQLSRSDSRRAAIKQPMRETTNQIAKSNMAPRRTAPQRRISEPYSPGPLTGNMTFSVQNSTNSGMGGVSGPNIEELFYCLLCIERFTTPKMLNCQHMFCDECLDTYFKTYRNDHRQQMELSILCPTCRKPTKVPPNGIPVVDLKKTDARLTVSGRKMSAVTDVSMQRCEVCVYQQYKADSDYYCIKCAINMCSNCKTLHSKAELFRSHQVRKLKHGRQLLQSL